MKRPRVDAIQAAESVARRSHGRSAQVRREFVVRSVVGSPTPVAELLRGGRGGHVRLKLLVSMIWLASAPPHDVAYPARAWATLLDLDDPPGRGARRVNQAISWLEEHQFLTVEARPGHPSRVTLLSEAGTGEAYTLPGAQYGKLRNKNVPAEDLARHRYFQIPSSFWTSGWLAILSGPAVAMYLVLLAESTDRTGGGEIWFSPALAAKRYALSDDTRSKGLRELKRAGLISTARRPVSSDIFDVQRFRNVHVLQPDKLNVAAEVPPETPSHKGSA